MDYFNHPMIVASFQTSNKTGLHNNQETSDQPSDFKFCGGSPTSFTAAAGCRIPLFSQNMEISKDYGCAGLSLLQNGESMEAMRETIFRMAMMQPVQIEEPPETLDDRPRRKNVRISSDPQSVAARRRRERISQRIRVLQRMVPGGSKLDTASMLDEAVHYMKFLKKQVQSLEEAANSGGSGAVLFPLVGGSNMQMLS